MNPLNLPEESILRRQSHSGLHPYSMAPSTFGAMSSAAPLSHSHPFHYRQQLPPPPPPPSFSGHYGSQPLLQQPLPQTGITLPPMTQARDVRTSSAYSEHARSGENWTSELDVKERRKLQNRIAQRKYRKKGKVLVEACALRARESGTPEDLALLEAAKAKANGTAGKRVARRSGKAAPAPKTQSPPAAKEASNQGWPASPGARYNLQPAQAPFPYSPIPYTTMSMPMPSTYGNAVAAPAAVAPPTFFEEEILPSTAQDDRLFPGYDHQTFSGQDYIGELDDLYGPASFNAPRFSESVW